MRADQQRGAEAPPSDGAVISRAMVRLLHDTTGRGPTRARTTIARDHVLVMLHDSLTTADRNLAAAGHEEDVHAIRHAIQEIMRPEAVRLIEETLGRKVVAFLSSNHLDPDIAAELFVLSPHEDGAGGLLDEGEARRDGAPEGSCAASVLG